MACVACSGGAAAMMPQLRMIGTAMAATTSLSGYKALVCIYLQGGNDSWNLVVPWDSNGSNQRYDVYSAARNGVYNSASNPGGLALARPASGNAQIVTDGNDGNSATNKYFLHPNLTNLASYFKAQQARVRGERRHAGEADEHERLQERHVPEAAAIVLARRSDQSVESGQYECDHRARLGRPVRRRSAVAGRQ